MKKFCNYKITNLINNKIYIGKTAGDTSRRWKAHIKNAGNIDAESHLYKSMFKYGIENFNFEVLEYFDNEDEAYEAEKRYIKLYNSNNPNIGYNKSNGGRGPNCDFFKKLNNDELKIMLETYLMPGMSVYKLCKKFNLAKPTALSILHRRTYISVEIPDDLLYQVWLKIHRSNHYEDQQPILKAKYIKLNPKIIKEIFNDFVNNSLDHYQIANKYNVRPSNILFILRRETWQSIEIDTVLIKLAKEKLNKILIYFTSRQNMFFIKNQIFDDYEQNISKAEISIKYNITIERITKILNGSCWKNVPLANDHKYLNKITQLFEYQALEIIKKYLYEGYTIIKLAQTYNTTNLAIKLILQRQTFKQLKIDCEMELQQKIKKEIRYRIIQEKDIPIIIKMYNDGKNFTQIGLVYDVGRKTIANLIEKEKSQNDI